MSVGEQGGQLTEFSVQSTSIDGISDAQDTRYTNNKFTEQYGFYTNITDIEEVIDAKAQWLIGKGYKADAQTTLILDQIKGYGKDSFNTIIENLYAMIEIGEDSYAEIIRDEKRNFINLKPLNTERMTIVAGSNGLIKHYEYSGNNAKAFTKFKPDEIFHLSRNRRGDEIHGRSMITVLSTLIKAKQQAIQDNSAVMHRYVMPQWKFKLKTDDPAEIAAYKEKMDAATAANDNIYEPFDVAESELMAVAPNATLNPLAYIQYLDAAFYKAAGVPQFIVGGGTGFTEASEKIAYLAWQQKVEKMQLYIEEQVGMQLGLEIELEFPASLENELLSDNKKDGAVNVDASETTAGSEQ